MNRTVTIEEKDIHLAKPVNVPPCNFIGRDHELSLCKMAWGIDQHSNLLQDSNLPPLNFRLQGPPGAGKNEIVYEMARILQMNLYIIQGHEELTPEDLALLLVPLSPNTKDDEVSYNTPAYASPQTLALRASPLATAIYEGGLFFFDEINRVPERALSPLSSVLDGRQAIYSAMTGIFIEPKDDQARSRFRFCCALNPALSSTGRVLPDYIEQRTLPVIQVDQPEFEELHDILKETLSPSQRFLDAFERWYNKEASIELSVRQAITLMSYAMKYRDRIGKTEEAALEQVAPNILGQ